MKHLSVKIEYYINWTVKGTVLKSKVLKYNGKK